MEKKKIGRPRKPEREQKTEKLVVHLTAADKARIEELAERLGFASASHFLRCRALGSDLGETR